MLFPPSEHLTQLTDAVYNHDSLPMPSPELGMSVEELQLWKLKATAQAKADTDKAITIPIQNLIDHLEQEMPDKA